MLTIVVRHKYEATVEPVYSGHFETSLKCADYKGFLIVQVSLYVKGYFETITMCPDYGWVYSFSSFLTYRFYCINIDSKFYSILFYYSFTVSSTEGLQQHVLQP